MANYYVSAEIGDDLNAGTSIALAFATIQKAIDSVSTAGDTITIDPTSKGYHVYAEVLDWTLSASGTSGSEIVMRADIEGEVFGNPGFVFITNKTTWDVINTTLGGTIDTRAKSYWIVENIIWSMANTSTMTFDVNGSTNWTWNRCELYLNKANTTSSTFKSFHEIETGWIFNDCTIVVGVAGSSSLYVMQIADTGGTIAPVFNNCRIYSGVNLIYNTGATFNSCTFIGSLASKGTGTIVNNNPFTIEPPNVAATYDGTEPAGFVPFTPLFTSWSILEKIKKHFPNLYPLDPFPMNPYRHIVNAATLPSGGDSIDSRYTATIDGENQAGARAQSFGGVDKQGEMTGDNSIVVIGSNYVDTYIPVKSGKTYTIEVDNKYDSTYASNNSAYPRIHVPAQLGTAEKTDTHSGSGANTTETLSVATDSLTANGFLYVRFDGFGTSTTANCFFDKIVVTEN